MQTIPYKIGQIKISQFAVFPDKYINGEEVQIHASFSFGHSVALDSIRCTAAFSFLQKEELLLTSETQCFFNIASEGIEQLRKEHEIPVDFLRYMATIATGTVRGIIHAKTEGTVLNTIILPPINLVNLIEKGVPV